MRTLFACLAALVVFTGSSVAAQIVRPPIARAPGSAEPGIYLITFRRDVPASQRAAVAEGHGARIRASYNASGTASVTVPDAAVLARLRNDPRILSVVENQRITLDAVQGRGGTGGSGKPKPPTALSAISTSSTSINLQWSDASNNETGFAIERCAGAGCSNFVEIIRVSANVATYANTGLSAQTLYRYRVFAFNGGDESKPSNVAEATTQAEPPPPVPPVAPSGLTSSAISHSQIDLLWTDNSSDELGFRIERCIGSGCINFSEIATTSANTAGFSDNGLAEQTAYRYRVRAFNTVGDSNYSNTVDQTTPAAPPPPPTPPAAPSGLTASPVSHTEITLSWADNSTDEDGFRIERCTGAGCVNFVEVGAVGANTASYPDSGLAEQTAYRYRVRAFNGVGNSSYSDPVDQSTPAAPPPPPPPPPSAPSGLTSNATSYSQINLSWSDNSSDESGFRIERCNGDLAVCGGAFVQIAEVGANVTTFSNMGLQAQTTYSYRVRAFSPAGASAYSNSTEATTPNSPPSSQIVPAGVDRVGTAPGRVSWTGTGVGVAIVDTGLDFAHADLGLQPEIQGVNSFNAFGGSCQDIHGHGTHVAGIVGARNNLIDVVGVAPNATIYCVNVFTPDPVEGVVATDESLMAGLEWIAANANLVTPRIRVVNMSLGRGKTFADNDPNHPVHLAVKALFDMGISLVVAAGNDPLVEISEQIPAAYTEVMSVTSTSALLGANGYDVDFPACQGLQAIKADTASYFTTDGRFVGGIGATISAPGETQEDMFDFFGSCFLEPIGILSLANGGGTVELSGTSMAAPHVAGVIALMWEKELSLGSSLAPELARTRIRNNADRKGTAPLDSPLEEYTFDGEREGVIWAPSALLDAPPPPLDAPPTITITSPAGGASFPSGASVAFQATATDPEDGNIAGLLQWTSSRDGAIGTGGSFSRVLSSGNHTISASLTDSGGNTGSASVSVTVGASSTPTKVQVSSVTYSLQGTTLRYTVRLVNEFGGPVAGASVRSSLYEWLFTGALWFSTVTTDSAGDARFQLLNADVGCYTTAAENVTAAGLTWIPGTPSNNFCIGF